MSPKPLPQLSTKLSPQRGIVLIEVLVAILIFSFGILGTVGLLARATQYSTNAEDRNRAALLANEIASQMWAADSVTLNAAVINAWNARVGIATASGLPGGVGTVAVAGNVATITVTWRPTFATEDSRYITQVAVQ